MSRSNSPSAASDSSIKRKRASLDDSPLLPLLRPNDRYTQPLPQILPTRVYPSPPLRPHTKYYNPAGDLEWESQEGVDFRVEAKRVFDALPILRDCETATPGMAIAKFRLLPAVTCEIVLDLVHLPADEVEGTLTPACETLGALAFCKRHGAENFVETLRPWTIKGTLAERTGHYAVWSFALGDDLKEIELLRAGAVASLMISDLTSDLKRGYFDRKPVSPAALIALTCLHTNRLNAAQLLLSTAAAPTPTTTDPSHGETCPTFQRLSENWPHALAKLRTNITPEFSPSVLLVNATLFGTGEGETSSSSSSSSCEGCLVAGREAVRALEERWAKVPDGSELVPSWW
ncbi:hypothetical protein T439DRAFT_322096 [Meredithblackwellia eburnea MCA 4105]